MPKGYIALVLHAHLPFVRHPEHEEFLEEDWLYEAITETYLPLLEMMDGLSREGIYWRLTMSMTPPLCAMLRDPLLQSRYVRTLNKQLALCELELQRTKYDPPQLALAHYYKDLFSKRKWQFEECYHRDLVSAFRRHQDAGNLEIITCGATHGYLPLMQEHPQAIRAQIQIAKDHYRECFGRDPRGIWLPECAYFPGLESFLREAEIRWFVLDTHALLHSRPGAQCGPYAPVFTPEGPAAFARDTESGHQVWSAQQGYPGDPWYREFYRDLGYDLPLDYVRPFIQPNGERKFTGIKYHRITGKSDWKEWYVPSIARERAAEHAGNFLFNRTKQVEHLSAHLPQTPIVLSPYDAELFGHWWYEGPQFLDFFFRKCACDQDVIQTITPSEYLGKFPTLQVVEPGASSWGANGFYEVWVGPSNHWIYPHLHKAADDMIRLAARYRDNTHPLYERAMAQLARELLLAQSSDWAFIMKTGTTVPYAVKRTKDHILRFRRLAEQLENGWVDETFLSLLESRDNIFPHLHWRHYL